MKYILFFGICFGYIFNSQAQFWVNSSDDKKDYPIGLRVDIISREIDPGVRLGIEYPISNSLYRILGNSNNKKEVNRQLLMVPNIAWYTKPGKQQSILPACEWITRRKNERGMFLEAGLSLGALIAIGDYTSKDFLSKNIAGGIYAAPAVSLGFGSDLFQVTDGKYKYLWNIRLHVPVLYGTSKEFIPIYMLQGGVSLYFPKKWVRMQQYRVYSRTSYN